MTPLPCPFCGVKAWLCEDDSEGEFALTFQVGCTSFGCRGFWKDSAVFVSREDAIEAWYHRSSSEREAAADTERLDWLAANCHTLNGYDDVGSTIIGYSYELSGQPLRSAIDAASASTPTPSEPRP